MIPKIIHYCWFGENPKSLFIENCISSWKKHLPEYQIRCWSENDFDLDSVRFVREAYQAKKWAFVADYIRFYALFTEGGIYMDTDVKVLRSFDESWFYYDFFSANEYHPGLFDVEGMKKLNENYLPHNLEENIDGFAVLSAIMGSEAKHPFLKDCIDVYEKINFINSDNSIDISKVIIGEIISKVAINYGYVYQDKKQVLKENMLILPSNVLVGNAVHLDDDSYAIHLINGSWLEKKGYEKFMHNIRNNYPKIFPLFYVFNKIRRKVLVIVKTK
jgi:mannosyltransferase OCH1-like enzyme